MIPQEQLKILTPLQKLPKNVLDLGKLIVATSFEKLPKSNNSPNLVTLQTIKCARPWRLLTGSNLFLNTGPFSASFSLFFSF